MGRTSQPKNDGRCLVQIWISQLDLQSHVARILQVLVNNDDANVLGVNVLDAPDCTRQYGF